MASQLRHHPRKRTWFQPAALVCLVAFTYGCDDGPPPLDENPAGGAKKTIQANPEAKAAMAKLSKKISAKKVDAPKVEMALTETDFVESSSNRDPFHPFLRLFNIASATTMKLQRRVLLRRYSLDELRLAAIVSGNTRPVAMFVDPRKKGVTIKRGDYISKSEGRVKQILPDKVIIEIQEKTDGRSTRTDRVILLHEKTGEDEDTEYDTLQ